MLQPLGKPVAHVDSEHSILSVVVLAETVSEHLSRNAQERTLFLTASEPNGATLVVTCPLYGLVGVASMVFLE